MEHIVNLILLLLLPFSPFEVPTKVWRVSTTIPRSLGLEKVSGAAAATAAEYRVTSLPVAELGLLEIETVVLEPGMYPEGETVLAIGSQFGRVKCV